MGRVALVVGINHYANKFRNLMSCADDARALGALLARHADNRRNFEVRKLIAEDEDTAVSRVRLVDEVTEIFAPQNETAIFYFAGHGALTKSGGTLICSDSRSAEDGVELDKIVKIARDSKATNRLVILDCCHAGAAGSDIALGELTQIGHGMTILASSTASGISYEEKSGGIFTSLLCNALEGEAANLLGDVTPGSIYAHIDQSLGRIKQRPVFKTSVQEFVSLRSVNPPVPLADLHRLPELFPEPDALLPLDPQFEPERPAPGYPDIPAPDPEKTEIFSLLQRCNRVNLVVPDGAPHFWHAAMERKHARLTLLGQHYWRLATSDQI